MAASGRFQPPTWFRLEWLVLTQSGHSGIGHFNRVHASTLQLRALSLSGRLCTFALLTISILPSVGCVDDSAKWDTAMDVPDKTALQMMLERMDAEEIDYWIDDDGKVRFKPELQGRIDAIADGVFERRSAGIWVIYDEADCDEAPILVRILEERNLEFLIEPMRRGAEANGCSIHWYPTDEHTQEDVTAEVRRRRCANLVQSPCDKTAQ